MQLKAMYICIYRYLSLPYQFNGVAPHDSEPISADNTDYLISSRVKLNASANSRRLTTCHLEASATCLCYSPDT